MAEQQLTDAQVDAAVEAWFTVPPSATGDNYEWRARMRSAIAAASPPVAVQEEGDAWQPIETAPVGVEMFLAAAIDYPVSKARKYTTDPWVVWQSATGVFIRWPHQFAPTHWAPIPAMKGDQP